MQDSPADQPTIMEVLAAYVRQHSPMVFILADITGNQVVEDAGSAPESAPASPPEDVLAILTVLGRRKAVAGERSIDLRDTDLTGANLFRANLARASLYPTNLYRAILYGADLTGANLYKANLTGANLTRTNFFWANLSRARLTRAQLTGANLAGANLTAADLSNTDLREVKGLKQKQIDVAVLDEESLLPPGLVRPTAPPYPRGAL